MILIELRRNILIIFNHITGNNLQKFSRRKPGCPHVLGLGRDTDHCVRTNSTLVTVESHLNAPSRTIID